ncbi:cation diffusion facilitator family transporter [Cellvibrio sp.]|uniref:cation diffusion facilitator family transporter n=1 Tax=Cellvibrio sp. TaxID=1965322 RepID=UPI0039648366
MNPVSSTNIQDKSAMENHRAAQRCTWISVAVNLVLSVLQVAVGLFASSQALIADGIHSLSDLVSDFVVLFAGHHSKAGPDEDHHYGHYRYENAASLVLGMILLGVGLSMLWAAVHKLSDPAAIPSVHMIALYVAAIALMVKELLFRYMFAVGQRLRSTLLIANAWHARSDAASSLVVALGIGGNLLGFPLLDPIAALVVGLMVIKMGWSFAWNSLHDLMDRAADMEEIEKIRAIILETPGVQGLHELRTRKTGDLIMVDVHLEILGHISVTEGHAIAVEARRRVMEELPVLDVMTHVDPVEAA